MDALRIGKVRLLIAALGAVLLIYASPAPGVPGSLVPECERAKNTDREHGARHEFTAGSCHYGDGESCRLCRSDKCPRGNGCHYDDAEGTYAEKHIPCPHPDSIP